ncbi:MAG: aminotransferase class IV, partial [Candidatus Omnitrophota bacterium]|nr:aminotransferase class IV [Candidatus Omnitrophota bacterium]
RHFLASAGGAGSVASIVVQPATLPPASAYRRGIALAVVPTRKYPVNTIDNQAKYSARLASVMAVADAQLRGADEALWIDALGYVTESTASNFGIIRGQTIVTPPCWLGLLAGITRDILCELALSLRLPLQELPLTRHDVYNADEAFLTSTLKEILPVTTVDGRRIGTGRPGPVSRRLLQAFRRLVKRERQRV